MRGDITIQILEGLKDAAVDSADLIAAFLISGYGASQSKITREAERIKRERMAEKMTKEDEKRIKHKYQNLIYKLKKDGLIKESKKDNGKILIVTRQGDKKLAKLKELSEKSYLLKRCYAVEQSKRLVIVAFDIPERVRHHRDWLRSVLENLGLTMIQKSVWMGKIKIPKTLIDDLVELKLIDFVEIFEVGNEGSLTHIT